MKMSGSEVALSFQRSISRKINLFVDFCVSLVGSYSNPVELGLNAKFCLFVGYPRSGSSLLGAIINAHPNALVSQERNSVRDVRLGFSAAQILFLIRSKELSFKREGSRWSGYDYSVGQGRNVSGNPIELIGDKKAGDSAYYFQQHPRLVDVVVRRLGRDVKFVHPVRNPYDAITTRALRSGSSLDEAITYFFMRCEGVEVVKSKNCDVLDVHLEDLVSHPSLTISQLSTFLGLQPCRAWMSDAEALVFGEVQRSRHKVTWSEAQIQRVCSEMSAFSYLDRYDFDN